MPSIKQLGEELASLRARVGTLEDQVKSLQLAQPRGVVSAIEVKGPNPERPAKGGDWDGECC